MSPSPDWVLAAPFRAHTRQLVECSGLPWRVVAAAAGVSPRAVSTLLHGRAGHWRPRLRRRDAQRLLALSPARLAAGRTRTSSASEALPLAGALLERGWTPATLARACEVPEGELLALMACATPTVWESLLWHLRALADAHALDTGADDADPAEVAPDTALTRIAA